MLIANHAMSAPGQLNEISGRDLALASAVNARAAVLLTEAFAEHHDDPRPGGHVLLSTA